MRYNLAHHSVAQNAHAGQKLDTFSCTVRTAKLTADIDGINYLGLCQSNL